MPNATFLSLPGLDHTGVVVGSEVTVQQVRAFILISLQDKPLHYLARDDTRRQAAELHQVPGCGESAMPIGPIFTWFASS
jgi:hypothetical protein